MLKVRFSKDVPTNQYVDAEVTCPCKHKNTLSFNINEYVNANHRTFCKECGRMLPCVSSLYKRPIARIRFYNKRGLGNVQ